MSSVENIELRRRLEEMTVSGGAPVNHRVLLRGISKEFPNTIQPLESSLPEDCYTCGMYVFDFAENEDYIKVVGSGFPHVYAGRTFFEWLLENHLLQQIEEAEANENDLIMYFNDGEWRHVGFWKLNGRVESKWGAGLLYNHGRWEVPTQYGETVRFFRAIAPQSAIGYFFRFAASRGVPISWAGYGHGEVGSAPMAEDFKSQFGAGQSNNPIVRAAQDGAVTPGGCISR